jgi:integrase
MANKIPLPNGCFYSIAVHPKNWKSATAKANIKWFIKYYFYQPALKPCQVMIKGMNVTKDLKGKQILTQNILTNEIKALESGYNPSKKEFIRVCSNTELSPDDTLDFALNYALIKARLEPTTRSVIKSEMNGFIKAAALLNYNLMPVKEVRRRHVITILEKCEETNPHFTDNTFNHYRKDMSILFKELVKREAIEHNPIDEFLELRKITKKIREMLSKEQRIIVDKYLRENQYSFWRYLQIFFHSGAREIELMQLQKFNIDLIQQRYKVIIKKGKDRCETWKIITDEALPYWQEIMLIAKENDYIFSKGLIPGLVAISASQINRRWKRVKKKLNLSANFYSLKHSKTTAVVTALDRREAAKLNSHKSEAMVVKIYDVEHKQRENDELKKVKTPFV